MTATDPEDRRFAVLFDMDGVLLAGRGSDASVHEGALDDALAERDLDPDAGTRGLLSGHEYDLGFVRGCDRLGVDPVSFYGLRERHAARRAVERLRGGARTLHDLTPLTDLAERYPLGVVSNNYHEVVRFVVDNNGPDVFDHVRGRSPGVRGFYSRKPNPRHLLEAMADLGADDGVYVGDRGTDVLAATRAGLDAAFVERPHNRGAGLPVEPTVRVGSLAELADWLPDARRATVGR